MPRIASFQQKHPDIDLRLQSSDREPDLTVETISLAVRLGDGNWPDCEAQLISDEVIYPVAAPRVMAAAVTLRSVPGLLNQRLIHLEEPIRERPSWDQWFSAFGITEVTPRSGLRLNDYALGFAGGDGGRRVCLWLAPHCRTAGAARHVGRAPGMDMENRQGVLSGLVEIPPPDTRGRECPRLDSVGPDG